MAQRPKSRAAGKASKTPAAPSTKAKVRTSKPFRTSKKAAEAEATRAATPKAAAPAKRARATTAAAKTPAQAKAPARKAAPKRAKTVKTAHPSKTSRPAKAARPDKAARPAEPNVPSYLAADLGQPTDLEGEPIGAGSATLQSDGQLQDYTLRLWRQMQSGGVVNRYMRAIEHAGLTIDEVWTAGVAETRTTSSTPDELMRYKQKLLFRANLLEAILSETVADLHRLDGIEPAAPGPAADPPRETA